MRAVEIQKLFIESLKNGVFSLRKREKIEVNYTHKMQDLKWKNLAQ